jgi:LPXTG-motif cell wall-anchored protein
MKSAFRLFAWRFVPLVAIFGLFAPAAFAQTSSVFTDPPKTYQLTTGWFQGRQTHYYDFGSNLTTTANASKVVPAPIYVFATGFDAQGNPQTVQGQHNVIDVVPGDPGYSDLWQVNIVVVPQNYAANTIKSADDVTKSGYEVKATSMLVNCPVVALNSTLAEPSPATGSTRITQGWYKGREVHYFDFGPAPDHTLPIFAFITGMDAKGNPQFVPGQHNIIDVIPGMPGYSPFWDVNLVKVPAGYKANSITSAAEVAQSGYQILHPGLVVNCPVVRTDAVAGGGVPVGMPNTGGADGSGLPIWAALASAVAIGAGFIVRRRIFARVRAK